MIPNLRRSILTSIRTVPRTIDGVRGYVHASESTVSDVLNYELQYGTVGWFNTSEAKFGEGGSGIRTSIGTHNSIELGELFGNSIDAFYLTNFVSSRNRRQIELFMARLLRMSAQPGTKYWRDHLEEHVKEKIKANRHGLERFVTEDLELNLAELREKSRNYLK